MAKPLKKFTVILNTNYGYYDIQVKAADFASAIIEAKEAHEPGEDDEVTVAATIKGWPETKLYG